MPLPAFVPSTENRIEVKKSSLAPSSVVFFGGNYLGSKLVEKLLEKESRVIVVDKFDSSKESYYINLKDNPKLLMISCDLETEIPDKISSCDYIYFLNYQDYFNPLDKFKIVETTQFTKNIINFALKSQGKIILVSNLSIKNQTFKKVKDTQRLIQEIIDESEETRSLNIRYLNLPIIYGPRMSFENSGGLNKILDCYLNKEEIFLDDENDHKNFFVYIDDAIEGIIRSLFNDKTNHKTISLVDSEPYSEMEIGAILKSISPRAIETKFYEEKNPIQWEIPDEKNLFLINFVPKVNLRNGLIKTLSYFGQETNSFSFKPEKIATDRTDKVLEDLKNKGEKTKDRNNEIKSPENIFANNEIFSPTIKYQKYKKTSFSNNILPKSLKDYLFTFLTIGLTFLLIFIIIPLSFIAFNLNQVRNNFDNLEIAVKGAEFEQAKIISDELKTQINQTYSNITRFKYAVSPISGAENYDKYEKLLVSLDSTVTGISSLSESLNTLKITSYNLMFSQEINVEDINRTVVSLRTSLENLTRAREQSKDLNLSITEVEKYKSYLDKIIELNKIILALALDNEDLLGFKEPKKILVLFQNPYEIRATGGFIGSYGVVEISKGKIISLKIDDIYNPDGQIDVKKIINPAPDVIRYFLKEDRLYIRNANYNSDFPESAKNINYLFTQATGENFQTIISIDTKFIEEFLKATGEVYLPEYEETITHENFVERAQFHSEINYQEGVSEKKSFLNILGSKILSKVGEIEPEQISELGKGFYGLLNNKNIQIYTDLQNLNPVLSELGWDGAVIPTKGDYLRIVNSNYGGNKVNYLTENKYSYSVRSMTRDGIFRGFLRIEYKNNARDNAWPYGDFLNYVKILVPVNSKLTNAKIIDQNGAEVSIMNNTIQSSESFYQTFETSFKIEPQRTKTLIIEYDLPDNLKIVKGKNTSYSLLWQKQAGDSSVFNFDFTPIYGFEGVNPISNYNLVEKENDFIISSNFSGNLKFKIDLK
jgi:nucleoside-diphosphate-sugar epimerase